MIQTCLHLKFGQVAKSEKGKKPKKSYLGKAHGLIPYIDIKAFEEKKFSAYTNGEKCLLCDDNDILLVWDGSRSGLVGKAYKGAVGSTLAKISSPHIERGFIYYYLLSKYRAINTRSKGTGTPHVDPDLLWGFSFPLFSSNEQAQIVNVIEELLSDLDNAIENFGRAEQQLALYRQSVLKAAFEGKFTALHRKPIGIQKKDAQNSSCNKPFHGPFEIPETWEWSTFHQLGEITGGLTKNPKRELLPSKMPYLRVANVYANEFNLTEIKEIGVTKHELERILLRSGDLLIVEGNGSADQIGRVALWTGQIDPCVHQNHLIKARFSGDHDPSYYLYWLLSPVGRDIISKVASSTSGLHTLSISKIDNLVVPHCHLLEQRAIVAEIESRFSICDELERTIQINSQKIELLKQSVLNCAFEGTLTEHWRKEHKELIVGENSAEHLLKKIMAEKIALNRTFERMKKND